MRRSCLNRCCASSFLLLALLAGCDSHRPAPVSRPLKPRIDATLPIGDDGRVHVIAIPGEAGEITRCIVAVTPAGHIATSCSPKDIEATPLDQ
jgi:hypothetical protein